MNRSDRDRIKAQAEQDRAARELLKEMAPPATAQPLPPNCHRVAMVPVEPAARIRATGETAPEPVKPKREKKPAGQTLTHSCGHQVALAHHASMPCGACRQENRRKNAAKRREQQAAKAPAANSQRLPDGSSFEVSYSAAETLWRGALTVPGAGTFMAEQSGVFRLLGALDMLYREWRGKQVENPEDV